MVLCDLQTCKAKLAVSVRLLDGIRVSRRGCDV